MKKFMTMKSTLVIILAMFLAVGFMSTGAKAATMTIATFADPSEDSDNPLFTLTSLGMGGVLSGAWLQSGLTLDIPYNGNTIEDVFFIMAPVTITDGYGTTTGGTVIFFKTGEINPLIQIDFQEGFVSSMGMGADEFFVANNVTFSGSQIGNMFSEEEFSFAFVNKTPVAGENTNLPGFTATASFTSSAVPEPATVCILSLGALSMLRRKK